MDNVAARMDVCGFVRL